MDLQRCNFWSARGKKQQKIGVKKHFIVLWRVFPFSSSDPSLLLCFLARLMCFCLVLFSLRDWCFECCCCCGGGGGGVPLVLLLLVFVVKLICLVSVFWVVCFGLGLLYSFGGWAFLVCLLLGLCVCVCAYFFCSMWQLLEFEFLGVKVFVCLLLLLFVFLLWKEWVFEMRVFWLFAVCCSNAEFLSLQLLVFPTLSFMNVAAGVVVFLCWTGETRAIVIIILSLFCLILVCVLLTYVCNFWSSTSSSSTLLPCLHLMRLLSVFLYPLSLCPCKWLVLTDLLLRHKMTKTTREQRTRTMQWPLSDFQNPWSAAHLRNYLRYECKMFSAFLSIHRPKVFSLQPKGV